MLIQKYELTH